MSSNFSSEIIVLPGHLTTERQSPYVDYESLFVENRCSNLAYLPRGATEYQLKWNIPTRCLGEWYLEKHGIALEVAYNAYRTRPFCCVAPVRRTGVLALTRWASNLINPWIPAKPPLRKQKLMRSRKVRDSHSRP